MDRWYYETLYMKYLLKIRNGAERNDYEYMLIKYVFDNFEIVKDEIREQALLALRKNLLHEASESQSVPFFVSLDSFVIWAYRKFNDIRGIKVLDVPFTIKDRKIVKITIELEVELASKLGDFNEKRRINIEIKTLEIVQDIIKELKELSDKKDN